MSKAVQAKKKGKNNYKMPDPLPKGEVLEDLSKKRWRLGDSIGKGGFGEIYSAQEAENSGPQYPFVIKIEPHGNGPLFVEMHVYMKIGKPSDIDKYMIENNLKNFGMPSYFGSGSHTHANQKYRFIVMKRYHSDLNTIFEQSKCIFSAGTVFKLSLQILDVLEYIHDNNYVHADIKATNILFEVTKTQAYLVDFGLTTKFTTEKTFKPNPKKAHDGTIEYLSRDAHQGVQTRRGDLEILAYNIIEWLGGKLPWGKELKDPKVVHQLKEENMKDIKKFLKASFGGGATNTPPPDALVQFLKYLNSLNFNTKPNYKEIKRIFEAGVKIAGYKLDGLLDFPVSPVKRKFLHDDSPKKKAKVVKKTTKAKKSSKTTQITNGVSSENLTEEMEPPLDDSIQNIAEALKKGRVNTRKNAKIENNNENIVFAAAITTNQQTEEMGLKKNTGTVPKVNRKIRSTRKKAVVEDNGNVASSSSSSDQQNSNVGYTNAMKEIASKIIQNGTKGKSKKKGVLESGSDESSTNKMNALGHTAEMQEIATKRQLRGRRLAK